MLYSIRPPVLWRGMPKEADALKSEHPPSSAVDPVQVLLEEYRQMYVLAGFRLHALDQRVPAAGALLTGTLGTLSILTEPLQWTLLIALPLSFLWLLGVTINHARSFEDALRRIQEIETEINQRCGQPLMAFQSSHPSGGVHVGGRTGRTTVEVVLAASVLVMGFGVYAAGSLAPAPSWPLAGYGLLIATVAAMMHRDWRALKRYRYERGRVTGTDDRQR